jgi:hypothetical protein
MSNYELHSTNIPMVYPRSLVKIGYPFEFINPSNLNDWDFFPNSIYFDTIEDLPNVLMKINYEEVARKNEIHLKKYINDLIEQWKTLFTQILGKNFDQHRKLPTSIQYPNFYDAINAIYNISTSLYTHSNYKNHNVGCLDWGYVNKD